MSFGFPQRNRLCKKADFRGARHDSRKTVTKHLVIYEKPSVHTQSRIGLVVSRKVGKAFERNRVKRHLREIFRHARHNMPSNDYVVIARPSARKASQGDLLDSFQRGYRHVAS